MNGEGENKTAPSETGEGDLGKWWSEVDSFRTLIAQSGPEIVLLRDNLRKLVTA